MIDRELTLAGPSYFAYEPRTAADILVDEPASKRIEEAKIEPAAAGCLLVPPEAASADITLRNRQITFRYRLQSFCATIAAAGTGNGAGGRRGVLRPE